MPIAGSSGREHAALARRGNQILGRSRALAAYLSALDGFDLIIFTSANAVRFGASFLGQKRDLPLAALGAATARALNQAGYRVAVQPVGTTDSEGLLLHPRLEHLAGHRILIVKGSNGRQLLEQELTRRGAQVVQADVDEVVPALPARRRWPRFTKNSRPESCT